MNFIFLFTFAYQFFIRTRTVRSVGHYMYVRF
jgi:hypothetical protein